MEPKEMTPEGRRIWSLSSTPDRITFGRFLTSQIMKESMGITLSILGDGTGKKDDVVLNTNACLAIDLAMETCEELARRGL